jgi:tetratricopeptide (TPR) repeat protein
VSSWRLRLALAAALSVTGCALFAGSDTTAAYPAGLPIRAELPQVPFYPQEEYQCGPAALAMVVSYAGVLRTPQQLVEQVYLPERKGSLQPEMLAATRRAGLVAYRLAPELPAVWQEVAAGHPVLVLQNLLFDLFPRWHYAVVVGYDLASRDVVLRSGTKEQLVMSQRAFENSWAKAGNWAFVALAPAQLPATAREDDYVAAVAALERVSPEAARQAYGAALGKWPGNLVARIALGNIAYGAHRLPEAEADYRQATQEHPDSADAWNNLAQVLHELGRDEQASSAAQRAIAIGGPRQPVYRSTLEAIRSAGPR